MLRLYVLPHLGGYPLRDLTPSVIRRWHGDLNRGGSPGPSTTARAYRCLRTVLNVAVTDGLIAANPCRIKGAGEDRSPARKPASPEQAVAIADAIEPRYRALVLLAATSGLRWGELAALARRHIDIERREVTVERTLVETTTTDFGPPKSKAGYRTVAIPASIMGARSPCIWTIEACRGPGTLIVHSRSGRTSPAPQLQRRVWKAAITRAGVEYVVVHQLRHLASTMAADAGASTKTLMRRMGHSTADASLRYQHASRVRGPSHRRFT